MFFISLLCCLACGPADEAAKHTPAQAVANLELYPGLEATLFSAEPTIVSPTNLDVDYRGRVWVTEVVNYREHGYNNERPEGDRILILEDTDGDAVADSTKVYYQGRDVDAALGIAVLGNQVIVTCAPNVIIFTDEDGDDKPDKKEYLFTNSGSPQNDHSTHSVLFGPDGKLYWNMGNAGRSVHDKEGKLVVDLAGNPIIDRTYADRLRENPSAERPDHTRGYEDQKTPYQGGMVFRCNLDGSGMEVLGHNFRNNYEVTVDSLGNLWQSDNDDDGNYGCRLNYVLEFGNFGYRDELTGGRWPVSRTGRHEEIPKRHWHQNDPGVVPNLLITGAGSPTGITVYEGKLLPKELWNQVLHADAGPGVVRAVLTKKDGAGFTAESVNVLRGERDKWVRPVDVSVAPDGSLFVTDWYDPLISWNRMEDTAKGRVFRIAPKGPEMPWWKFWESSSAARYEVPEFDFDTPEGAVAALKSPNYAVRYLAWSSLNEFQQKAAAALAALFSDEQADSRHRARALWLLTKIDDRAEHYLNAAASDKDEDIRVVAVRAARQLDMELVPFIRKLARDPSPQVRRECAIALRGSGSPQAPGLWAELGMQYDGNDRWYLEALGIGASGQWDDYLAAWLKQAGSEWNSPAGRDIIWRSRARSTPNYLTRILRSPDVDAESAPRFLRAFDFQEGAAKSRGLHQLAFGLPGKDIAKETFVASEALLRMPDLDPASDPALRASLSKLLDRAQGTEQFALLVQRYKLKEHYPALMAVAAQNVDNPLGITAIKSLLDAEAFDVIEGFMGKSAEEALNAVAVLGNSRAAEAVPLLQNVLLDEKQNLQAREQAVRSLARIRTGAETIVGLAKQNQFPEDLLEIAGAAMTRSMHVRMREEAETLFPIPPTKNKQPVPGMTELIVYVGTPERGRKVFESATCTDCHIVDGQGTNFGPELSKIGDKLAKEGLYDAILDPSAGVSPEYNTHHLTLAGNQEVEGFIVNETAGTVTLRMEGGVVADYSMSEITDRRTSAISAMPSDLQEQMTVDELVDLVEYLTTLK